MREGNKLRKEREKERIFRERDFNSSLNFPMIGPSNSSEARRKVGPHYKTYTWVPVLWSFDKLREVGVFSYLVYFRLKNHLKWFGLCEAVSGHLVSPKTWDLMLEFLGPILDSPELISD